MTKYGWLIELKSTVFPVPHYYGENEEGVLGWTAEHMKAIRFARRVDAELVIRCEGWTEASAAEHAWDDTPLRRGLLRTRNPLPHNVPRPDGSRPK